MANLQYLTQSSRPAIALAGDYLVPVRLPSPGRVYWQKLYWSRLPDNLRAEADRHEALILGEAIQQVFPDELNEARAALPAQWERQLASDRRLMRMFSNRSASPLSMGDNVHAS
jgi:hypothetical protein